MKLSTKVSALTLLLGAAFSASAFATGEVWDSTAPWGSSATAEYAEWNNFDSVTSDTTPDIGSGTFSSSGGGFLFGTDIYTFNSVPSFTISLTGTSGLFDVYLRVASQGNALASSATLNGIAASSILAYSATADLGAGSESEQYWVWNNVTGSSLYTFTFNAAAAHILVDQIAVATVAAVPEPSTYGMMAIGLGMLGFMGRRSRKNNSLA